MFAKASDKELATRGEVLGLTAGNPDEEGLGLRRNFFSVDLSQYHQVFFSVSSTIFISYDKLRKKEPGGR